MQQLGAQGDASQQSDWRRHDAAAQECADDGIKLRTACGAAETNEQCLAVLDGMGSAAPLQPGHQRCGCL